MRALTLFLVLILVGCAKGEDPPQAQGDAGVNPDNASHYVTLTQAPQECTYLATGAYSFQEWQEGNIADTYSCPSFPNMTCTLAIDNVHGRAEMMCSGTTATPPAYCSQWPWAPTTNVYDCHVWHSALRCFFFDNGGSQTVKCLDNDLPYY